MPALIAEFVITSSLVTDQQRIVLRRCGSSASSPRRHFTILARTLARRLRIFRRVRYRVRALRKFNGALCWSGKDKRNSAKRLAEISKFHGPEGFSFRVYRVPTTLHVRFPHGVLETSRKSERTNELREIVLKIMKVKAISCARVRNTFVRSSYRIFPVFFRHDMILILLVWSWDFCFLAAEFSNDNVKREEAYIQNSCGTRRNKRICLWNDTCDRLSTFVKYCEYFSCILHW